MNMLIGDAFRRNAEVARRLLYRLASPFLHGHLQRLFERALRNLEAYLSRRDPVAGGAPGD